MISNVAKISAGPVQFSSARTALSDKPLSSGGLSTPKALPLPPLSPIRNTVVNTAYNHLPTAPRHPVSPLHAKPAPTETSQSASPPQSLPATLPSSGSDEYRSSTRRLGMGRMAGGYANKKFKTPGGGDDL
ncbi:uncharacterized protein B0H18DRAFT_1039069 [Fomitopsis serialis]|uniref:uncharacterized protein n=1 Tax=Fomitopsis serialis TaxID=139415 RepID=UPI002007D8A1|nr:uncharacterized protein B0H18DRAFT_1039069 [Neoantrodia serialis]KAH9916182.1 hypothetical protein B0H18DRAFT_1039069 [Neoantrodia serialis]